MCHTGKLEVWDVYATRPDSLARDLCRECYDAQMAAKSLPEGEPSLGELVRRLNAQPIDTSEMPRLELRAQPTPPADRRRNARTKKGSTPRVRLPRPDKEHRYRAPRRESRRTAEQVRADMAKA